MDEAAGSCVCISWLLHIVLVGGGVWCGGGSRVGCLVFDKGRPSWPAIPVVRASSWKRYLLVVDAR